MIRWQKPMVSVLMATVPCMLHAVYRFGWRALAVLGTSVLAACCAEWLFTSRRKEPVSSAALVTAVLLTLSLPPTIPLWIVVIGAAVGIVFGKEVFGGFGRNIYNPALVGRCFIYVCFPVAMTGRWAQAASGWPGGFGRWATKTIDAVTSATPLDAFAHGNMVGHLDLLLGNRTGCLGETGTIAILLGATILLARRAADWRLMVGPVLGMIGLGGIFRLAGVHGVPNPFWNLLAGGLLFAAVFMTTEPVSAARTRPGRWIFGIAVGCLTILIRAFGAFPCGVMFAILLMNTFNPAIDYAFTSLRKSRQQGGGS